MTKDATGARLSKLTRKKQRNRVVQKMRTWRSQRKRPRVTGVDRAALWRRRPLSIWPFSSGIFQGEAAVLEVPVCFSMIEAPDETLTFLSSLRGVIAGPKLKRLHLDHKTCAQVDLCASVLMDVLLMTAQSHWRRQKRHVRIEGSLPDVGTSVHKLLVNSGVVAHLVNPEVPEKHSIGVERFVLVRGGLNTPLSSARKEIVSSQLAAYFDRCLRSVGFALKVKAQNSLVEMVSEILDNAELHCNSDGRWYAIGHFEKNETDGSESTCSIVLFNFGDSIYRSLKDAGNYTDLQSKLHRLSKAHEKGFSNPHGRFSEATLWTLYAIQDGVSRLAGKPGEVARGGGTVEMISFFNELSSGEQRMVIVSGNSLILNDGSFTPKKDEAGNTILAFNEVNNLLQAPDEKYVRSLKGSFPSTLISLRFPFDKKHLDSLAVQNLAASEDRDFKGLVVYVGLQKTD